MIRPVNNNIIVKEIEENIKTNSGLLINRKETNIKKVRVIKIIDNIDFIKENDTVLILKEDMEEIVFNNEQYFIVKQDKIKAVIEE